MSQTAYFGLSSRHVGWLLGVERIGDASQHKHVQLQPHPPPLLLLVLLLLLIADVRRNTLRGWGWGPLALYRTAAAVLFGVC